MIRLALRELASRRVATVLTGLGLIVASLGFVVLIGTSQTTSAHLRGNIGQAWNTPYDILVRPPGTETAIEREQGLVRPNFLGAVTGGITTKQLAAIRAINGVEVAAPVAVAGELYFFTSEPVNLTSRLGPGGFSIFRLTQQRTADAGLSKFPASQVALIVAASSGSVLIRNPGPNQTATLMVGSQSITCQGSVSCTAPRFVCEPASPVCTGITDTNWLLAGASFAIPMVIAGIDPAAEARIAGLDHCLREGRYLNSLDQPVVHPPTGSRIGSIVLPALLSTQTPIDESVTLNVDRIDNPALTTASPATLDALGGWRSVDAHTWSAQDFYQTIFTYLHGGLSFSNNYTPGDVVYTSSGGQLAATTVTPDPSVYSGSGPGSDIPPDAADTWFRPVTVRASVDYVHGSGTVPVFDPIGTYDPSCLASFNPLAGGKLETYAAPAVKLSDGRSLGPNASLAGYVNAPPSALTTLDGIRALEDPARYADSPGDAFISAIRIRVSGVDHPGAESEHRLTTIAAAIKEATGLEVDIVKGASPRPQQVLLPAGNFGRPALTVVEPWSEKGVAFVFSQAITTQNLALFFLALVGAAGLVGQSTYTAVKRRHREFGVLRALGWPGWRIAMLVEVELLVLSLLAGAIAALAGVPIAARTGFTVAPLQLWLAAPVAVMTALIASLGPAVFVSRRPAVEVIERPGRLRRSRPLHGALMIGFRGLLTEWRWEALIGVLAIAIGCTLIGGVVLIAEGFRGQLDVSVLGTFLTEQVRPFHIALALIVSTIGAVTVAQITLLAYLERRRHMAVLRALGWPTRSVAAVIVAQALTIAAAGGVVAVLTVLVVARLLHAPLASVLTSEMAIMAAASIAFVVAAFAPLVQAYSGRIADSLRGE